MVQRSSTALTVNQPSLPPDSLIVQTKLAVPGPQNALSDRVWMKLMSPYQPLTHTYNTHNVYNHMYTVQGLNSSNVMQQKDRLWVRRR